DVGSGPAISGSYVLKRFKSAKKIASGKLRVWLESDNAKYAPIVMSLDDPSELRIVAELVEVLA
ncbi:MAG: hypothetical protein ACREJX_03085, partial [Polyangiaceae bacterium]